MVCKNNKKKVVNFKKTFPTMYCKLNLEVIWLMFLWFYCLNQIAKLTLTTLLAIIPNSQVQVENVSPILIFRFKDISNGILRPIWTLFTIYSFVSKIWDIYGIPIPKMGDRLRMLGFNSLHSVTCECMLESQNILLDYFASNALALATSPNLGSWPWVC